jgi:hypothetical protein
MSVPMRSLGKEITFFWYAEYFFSLVRLLRCSMQLMQTFQMKVAALLLVVLATAGETLENFEVLTDDSAVTKFGCEDYGARCVFRRSNYKTVDFGSGQETENEQGAVWAAVADGAVLTLGPCTNEENCTVTCNANCTCAYVTDDSADPQLCAQVISRAPTPAPKTEAPVASTCPQRQFTEYCPDLMNNAIPEGVEGNYDCFNFCGGVWISICDYAGYCGPLDCDNKTATGTLNGLVFGCTSSSNSTPTPSSTPYPRPVSVHCRLRSPVPVPATNPVKYPAVLRASHQVLDPLHRPVLNRPCNPLWLIYLHCPLLTEPAAAATTTTAKSLPQVVLKVRLSFGIYFGWQ